MAGQNLTGRSQHDEPKDTNIISNITKLLPANTFLMFQMLAPMATNDGHCGKAEIIMTSAMLIILASTCMLVCFTDTMQYEGKVHHGLVTPKGLWNPSFKSDPCFNTLPRKPEDPQTTKLSMRCLWNCFTHLGRNKDKPKALEKTAPYMQGSTYSNGTTQYELNGTDFLHAVLSTMAFGALTMLTSPVTTCFYPKIPITVVKTLPLLVGFVISGIFAFSPPARNDIAHPLPPKKENQPSNTSGTGNDVEHGAEKIGHSLPDEAKEVNQLPLKAAPVAEPSKDQEASKSVPHDALVKAGAHPASAKAAVQDAKDPALTQKHHELQAATSKPLAGLSRQVGSQPAASVAIDMAPAAAGQSGIGHAQRGAEQLPRVTEEIVAQASVRAPTASQVPLASTPRILHPDRQESTEIMDSISKEEITSESEAELSNRGDFRAGSSSSFNLQGRR